MRMIPIATHLRREFICKTIHEYTEKINYPKKKIYKALTQILRISEGTIRDIHRDYCFNGK